MEKTYYKCSLCIRSEILSAKEITNILKIKPKNFHEKGSLVSVRNPNGPKRNKSLWSVDSTIDEEKELHEHIKELILIIEKNIDRFKQLIETCSLEIFCGFFSDGKNGSVYLDSNLIDKLNIIPLEFIVMLYPQSLEEE